MSFVHLYGKADIEDAVTAGANETPMGGVPLLFEDAVKAVFISAVRAYVEFVLELDFLYFSIHYITFYSFTVNWIYFIHHREHREHRVFLFYCFPLPPLDAGQGRRKTIRNMPCGQGVYFFTLLA